MTITKLEEDGNYVLLKLVGKRGDTNYRVQENKYGEEWDWTDVDTLEEAELLFIKTVADFKIGEEKRKTEEAEDKEKHGADLDDYNTTLDRINDSANTKSNSKANPMINVKGLKAKVPTFKGLKDKIKFPSIVTKKVKPNVVMQKIKDFFYDIPDVSVDQAKAYQEDLDADNEYRYPDVKTPNGMALNFYNINEEYNGKFTRNNNERITNDELKSTMQYIIDKGLIEYSYSLDNNEQDEDVKTDTFFIQVNGDDNSHFSIFMSIYQKFNEDEDLRFWKNIDEPMECYYNYTKNEDYIKELQTGKLIAFLEGINAQKVEYYE